jgi:hypothetical protein
VHSNEDLKPITKNIPTQKVINKVKIGYFDYDINYIAAEEAKEREILGEIFHDTNKIDLSENLKQNTKNNLNVLLHECMHGWFNSIGCNIRELKYGESNDEIEEFFVNNFTQGFLTILLDNQDLLDLLAIQECVDLLFLPFPGRDTTKSRNI